ncbi:MAG: hypothetical protein WEC84_01120 [Candidatus Andersenbacteria bacterium]
MHGDPFDLDQTEFAKTIHKIGSEPHDELPEEPPHPLCESALVAMLSDHLRQMNRELYETRKPNGDMSEDAYFMFDEGLMLRTEVIAALAIQYLREHPELLDK